MTRLENFREKGFFAHAIVSLVKLDKGCSFTPLWTYFYAIGKYSYAIGDSLLRYWGFTRVVPQCFFRHSPMILLSFLNDSFVIPSMSLRSDFDGLYVVK